MPANRPDRTLTNCPRVVFLIRTQYVEVLTTPELEATVLEALDAGQIASETTRADYDRMSIDDQAYFLAETAEAAGMHQFGEVTGGYFSVVDQYVTNRLNHLISPSVDG